MESAGRIELSDAQAADLWWTKKVFVTIIPLAIGEGCIMR